MQTSVSTSKPYGRAGMKYDNSSFEKIISKICEGSVKAGLGVFRVPGYGQVGTTMVDPGSVYQGPSPVAAADVDAIIASGASAATEQTISGTGLTGVVGDDVMYPARTLTLVLSNHTDWDATTAVWTGKNEYGQSVTENVAIPNGGNGTVTTTGRFSQVTSLYIPAQTGAGGTFTAGVSILDGTVNLADFVGVALLDLSMVPNVVPSQDQTAEYHDADTVSVMRKGAIWVETEDACSEGGDVYVRVGTGAGGSQLGAFRSDADTASAVQITGARWGKDSSASGLNVLELY
jgi:hypothetical protein